MEHGTDDRGVSEVMGFILVFGMLVLSFTVYQGIVVPDQNRQVEFEHNQAVQGQFQDLRNAIVSTTGTGSGQAVSVTLGATYPTRALARNLGVSGGSLQTTDGGDIHIQNVRALNGETADYLNGDLGPIETKTIRYTPVYSFYSDSPDTIYENTLAYNQFNDVNLTLTDQAVIDGRRITLIAINGSLSKAQQDTVSINTEALSASSNRVAIRNATSGPINITIPTQLPADEWKDSLEDEMEPDGHVVAVHPGPGSDNVTIELNETHTYDLRMAKVGVGDLTEGEEAEYVTTVDGNGTSVPAGGSAKLVIEVRDRFNNPVSGVPVKNQADEDIGGVSPDEVTTDSDGRATFTYQPDASVAGDWVDVTVGFGDDERENVTFRVNVMDTFAGGIGGEGGAGGGKPGGPVTNARLEDLSRVGDSGIRYVASYELSNVKESFSAVSATFDNIDQPSASGQVSSTEERGSLEYTQSYGAGDTWQVSVRVFYEDNGTESLESVRQFHDTAEGLNPTDNADLGDGGSPEIDRFNVTDISGVNFNPNPRYRLNYSIDNTEDFQYVEAALIGIDGGGYQYDTSTSSEGEFELTTYGQNEDFQVKLLVYDDDDVVVDYRDLDDNDRADGNGP